MSALGWETASRPRHAELVSASMAGPLTLRCAEGNGRPWTLKQVQGDDDGNVAFRSLPADDAPLSFSAPPCFAPPRLPPDRPTSHTAEPRIRSSSAPTPHHKPGRAREAPHAARPPPPNASTP